MNEEGRRMKAGGREGDMMRWQNTVALVVVGGWAWGAEVPTSRPADMVSPRQVMSPERWDQVDRAVERGLAYIAARQRKDGSFEGPEIGQPGVTSLCTLAFLSAGYVPGHGKYARQIEAGIQYVMSCQRADGLICLPVRTTTGQGTSGAYSSRHGIYNHAIGGLLLSEVYGMRPGQEGVMMRGMIEKAVAFTVVHQKFPGSKRRPDVGGWRYLQVDPNADSDLSVTSWQLLFLRSAKNAGFEVDSRVIGEGLGFVGRCFDQRTGAFDYFPGRRLFRRAMAGAGMLSLSLGGQHDQPLAKAAGEWLLKQGAAYDPGVAEHYQYGSFFCSHGMYQLGGKYYAQFYPLLVQEALKIQQADGAWRGENNPQPVGSVYTTAMMVLALRAPHEVLPVLQR